MLIKAINTIIGPDYTLKPGEIGDVPDRSAKNLIKRKAAIKIKKSEAKPENKSQEPKA